MAEAFQKRYSLTRRLMMTKFIKPNSTLPKNNFVLKIKTTLCDIHGCKIMISEDCLDASIHCYGVFCVSTFKQPAAGTILVFAHLCKSWSHRKFINASALVILCILIYLSVHPNVGLDG